MAFNLTLEDGSKLLLENGNGIFLEEYVPPNVNLTVDVVADDPIVSTTVRINTPKFWSVPISITNTPVVTLGSMVSSPPAKFISAVVIAVDDTVVSLSTAFDVSTPRHLRPRRKLVWVYGLDGNRVNVLD